MDEVAELCQIVWVTNVSLLQPALDRVGVGVHGPQIREFLLTGGVECKQAGCVSTLGTGSNGLGKNPRRHMQE